MGTGDGDRPNAESENSNNWPIGESRTFSTSDEVRLAPGGKMQVTGMLQVGDEGGELRPVITVDGVRTSATELRDENADRLADLLTHQHDLQVVVKRCDLALAALNSGDVDVVLACWEAAVIAYGRCFQNGQTSILKQTRQQLENADVDARGLKDVHEVMMKHRHRNVGHRVQHDWVLARVGLFRHPETGETLAIAPFTLYRQPDASSIEQLRHLASALVDVVSARIAVLTEEMSRDHGIS